MSVWTHVNCTIRIHGLYLGYAIDSLKYNLGRMHIYVEDSEFSDLIKESLELQDGESHNEIGITEFTGSGKLPEGSEGSLYYKIIPYETGIPLCVLVIWGDLRDYYDPDKIVKFLNEVIKSDHYWPGSGIADIHCEKDSEANGFYVINEDNVWEKI